jgi:hypothetical protein
MDEPSRWLAGAAALAFAAAIASGEIGSGCFQATDQSAAIIAARQSDAARGLANGITLHLRISRLVAATPQSENSGGSDVRDSGRYFD